jgi:hypothetical protein
VGSCPSVTDLVVTDLVQGNVIVGRLIPAGTGMEYYRNIQLSQELEEAAARVQQEVTAAFEEAERELAGGCIGC